MCYVFGSNDTAMKIQIAESKDAPGEIPPMSVDAFRRKVGISRSTMWRWVRLGMIQTRDIYGRGYIMPDALAEFNRRVSSGEFQRGPVGSAKMKQDARRTTEKV